MGRIIMLIAIFTASMISSTFATTQDADIKGKVINQNKEPVASATVYLMGSSSNDLIKSAITDDNGNYHIMSAPKGNYYIEVSSVGYSKSKSKSFELAQETYLVEDILITNDDQAIEAVTVQGKVPMVRNVNGKLVLNVENSTLAAGNNALEVVKRAPGVSVDKDDNLQLMGQQGVNVTIDGRQTYMTGEQLATFLKSTDASQIKSVEVGTSRSAKEDAEGAAGTINIVLKKNTTEGFNGSFVASAAHGEKMRANSSLNLNYKKNNTTLFGSYAYTDNKRQFDFGLERIISNNGQANFFDQEAIMMQRDRSHNYRVGIEHKTSEMNTMLFQFTGNNDQETSDNNSQSDIGIVNGKIDSILRSTSQSEEKFNRYSANFNNEYKIDTSGSKLTLDLDWSKFKTNTGIDYLYRTENIAGDLFYPQEMERSGMPVGIDIYVGKVDYVKPFKYGQIEAGVKYSNVKSDNNLIFEQKVDDTWENYEGRSNHFVYTEQISAGYLDYSTAFGKFTTKLGVRAEHTISDGNSITKENRVKRDYLDFFPSANLGYNVNENNILSLSYAKKVSRPNYRYLNPFRYYIDKLTYQEGNPYVRPQYTHGFTLNYTLMQKYNFTLGTDITNDAMVESMGQDSVTKTTWITRENLAKNVTSYLNMNIPVRIGNFWTMNNNVTGIYMHFKGPIAGHYADLGSFFIQANSMNSFKLTNDLSAEANLNGNTPFLYNVYKISGRFNTDLGLNYNFKDKRSSLKLLVTDVFRTNKNNVSTDFEEFNSFVRQYHDNQTVRLTFNYKFGNLKQQFKRRDSTNEEKERAN